MKQNIILYILLDATKSTVWTGRYLFSCTILSFCFYNFSIILTFTLYRSKETHYKHAACNVGSVRKYAIQETLDFRFVQQRNWLFLFQSVKKNLSSLIFFKHIMVFENSFEQENPWAKHSFAFKTIYLQAVNPDLNFR